MTKESEEYKDLLKVGEKLNVQIIESSGSKQGSYILGSVEAGFKRAVFDEILDSVENSKTAYNAIVRSLIPGGGYIVEIQGVECFMPGSLAGINKLHDFESILNTEMYVVPMNYSSDRGTIVVSHREYLKAMIPTKIDEIKEYDHGVVVRGCVTGSAKFGIVCEFNECLTGMIHVNDLDAETMKRHLNREVTPGEEIEFFIKKIISETKITLSQKPVEIVSDPWYNVSDKFKTPVEVTGKIRSVKEYGAFIDIGDGLVGLLHVSEFPTDFDLNDLNRGDDITVTVTRIDEETRKVFMEL
jgi:small subunit ribosomal protein S1